MRTPGHRSKLVRPMNKLVIVLFASALFAGFQPAIINAQQNDQSDQSGSAVAERLRNDAQREENMGNDERAAEARRAADQAEHQSNDEARHTERNYSRGTSSGNGSGSGTAWRAPY